MNQLHSSENGHDATEPNGEAVKPNPLPWMFKLVKAIEAGDIAVAVEYRDELDTLDYVISHPALPPRADLAAVAGGHDASPACVVDSSPQRTSALGQVGEAVVRLGLSGVEPVIDLENWAVILGTSRSGIERMRRAGELPEPDFFVGTKSPRWLPSNVRQFLAGKAGNATR